MAENTRGMFRAPNGNGAGGCRSCDALEQKLKEIDFALYDVVLYLDAYPDSECALAYYHKLREMRETVLSSIHRQCGPMTMYHNHSTSCWDWNLGPWPWQYDACGKEK